MACSASVDALFFPIFTLDCCTYIGPLKETTTHLSMFPNKDTPCGQENEVIWKSHVTCRMLSIKKRLSPLFWTKYLIPCMDVRCYNNIKRSGKYSSDFVQNFAEKKRVLLCSANAWIRTHVTFPVIQKQCCRFLVVQSFQFEFTTYPTYLQGKHLQSIDRKYNYRECWCYIIRIKQCFLGTNQWLLLHVLAVCL